MMRAPSPIIAQHGRRLTRRADPAEAHFRVKRVVGGYRLEHVPSGAIIQQYLLDFPTRGAAMACRNRIIACDPSFDWSAPGFAETMTADLHVRVWKATYAPVSAKTEASS